MYVSYARLYKVYSHLLEQLTLLSRMYTEQHFDIYLAFAMSTTKFVRHLPED